MLEIKMFGSGELSYSGLPLSGFPNQQPFLLFCYLLLNRQHSQNREHLAAVFWGDSPAAYSRKMLRNVLWRLHQRLSLAGVPFDQYFQFEEDSICFLRTPPYYLDVDKFESCANLYQDIPGQKLTKPQMAELEAVATLYVGDLLEGVYEDWCLFERERLRLMYQSLLCKLMINSGVCGAYDAGIQYGLRLLTMDATWEKIHRQLMWLYWLSGDRGAAFAQYKLCQQILAEELNVQPTQETQNQYEQMLHNQFNPQTWLRDESLQSSPIKTAPDGKLEITTRIQKELGKLKDMIDATRAESEIIENLLDEALDL
jgi:DNA-binding SARP family transcriptional activator